MLNLFRKSTTLSINQIIDRLEEIGTVLSGVPVTAETCMRSPTVHAIVTAVSRRLAVSPIQVFREQYEDNGRVSRTLLPNHPLVTLLKMPNEWQNRVTFMLDGASQLIRYGNLYGVKLGAENRTRVPQRLIMTHAGSTSVDLADNGIDLLYRASVTETVAPQTYRRPNMFHARTGARNLYLGDSPIGDVKQAIGLEIAAEEYGAMYFGNGAIPLMAFQLMDGYKDASSNEEKTRFLESVKRAIGGNKRFSTFLLPEGYDVVDRGKLGLEHDKAQFLETRKYQRTVIAGAFNVPVHLVGDLERGTFNNVEQQDKDFTANVIQPYAETIEAAMEQDLLPENESGLRVRFNLDEIARADFKSRQEGLAIQRQWGVLSADEWRSIEDRNPLPEDERGDEYIIPSNFEFAQDHGQDDETTPDNSPAFGQVENESDD